MTLDQWVALLSGKYYGMVFLGLASAAYTSENLKDRQKITDDLRFAIRDSQYTPLLPEPGHAGAKDAPTLPGTWQVDWGPAISTEFSNLVYIASFRNTETSEPYLFVVGIRGTDTSTKDIGVLDQISQDLKAFKTRSWTEYLYSGTKIGDHTFGPPKNVTDDWPPPEGAVAEGSLMAFTKLSTTAAAMASDGTGDTATEQFVVVEALQKLLSSHPQTPVVVTGHSLGGCQTQTMTSYLTWNFQDTAVISHAFAPSTAGNAAFASTDFFKGGCFWWNTLDLVPCAYEKSRKVGTIPDLDVKWAQENLWQCYTWPQGSCWPEPKGTDLSGTNCKPLPADWFIGWIIKNHGQDVIDQNYARPIGKVTNCPLEGEIPIPETMHCKLGLKDPTTALSMLLWQHFPPAYQILMWKHYHGDLVYFDYKMFKEHHL
jgi:hypothetical protein